MNIYHFNCIREIDFTLEESSIEELKRRWQSHMANSVLQYPEKTFSGKGIVICGGGVQYFTCAWISIQYIKSQKCTLPIELWYIGDELNQDCIFEMDMKGVVCRNLADYNPDYIALKGVAIKPLCILHSSFEEILYIDADNICLENPERLFSLKVYSETGAVFWPDYWETAFDNPIWQIMGVPYSTMKEQESGQILIHKQKCWKALHLCVFLNLNHKVYHKLIWGDKDTFRFSWLALGQKFHMIAKQLDTCGYIDDNNNFRGFTMVQYNVDGQTPLFLHRNLIKWNETTTNKKLWQKIKRFIDTPPNIEIYIGPSPENGHSFVDFIKGYEMFDFEEKFGDVEDRCLQYLEELRNKSFYQNFVNAGI